MNQPAVSPAFLRPWFRVLVFRASWEDYEGLRPGHFWAGLAVTWIVGMGRYWDDPRAVPLQVFGIGSVIYIFLLAAVLWVIFKPIAPERFSYFNLLTFIALTSVPAALYAIPIEKWTDLPTANRINLIFLCVVAIWRVALLFHYLRIFGRLGWVRTFVCGTMPLALIFLALLFLNLHHVVLNIMGGIREADQSSQDAAYGILLLLSILAVPLSFVSGLVWMFLIFDRIGEAKRAAVAKNE